MVTAKRVWSFETLTHTHTHTHTPRDFDVLNLHTDPHQAAEIFEKLHRYEGSKVPSECCLLGDSNRFESERMCSEDQPHFLISLLIG